MGKKSKKKHDGPPDEHMFPPDLKGLRSEELLARMHFLFNAAQACVSASPVLAQFYLWAVVLLSRMVMSVLMVSLFCAEDASSSSQSGAGSVRGDLFPLCTSASTVFSDRRAAQPFIQLHRPDFVSTVGLCSCRDRTAPCGFSRGTVSSAVSSGGTTSR